MRNLLGNSVSRMLLNMRACPFVMEMPRSYELVSGADAIPLPMLAVTCDHKPGATRPAAGE
jgi:hypothetical protein